MTDKLISGLLILVAAVAIWILGFVLMGFLWVTPEKLVTEFNATSISVDDVNTIEGHKYSSSVSRASIYRVDARAGNTLYTLNLPVNRTEVHLNAEDSKVVQYCPRLGWYPPFYVLKADLDKHNCTWELFVESDELPWEERG